MIPAFQRDDGPWGLDPQVRFLNHGSFGACPRPVLARQSALRQQMERDPARFLVRDAPVLLEASRASLASFVGADPRDVVFVDNATTAVNTVLAWSDLEPGDEVLATDHGYRACNNAIATWAGRRGARLVVARVPFPLTDSSEVIGALLAACSPRTKLAVIDHVTSPTALVFPVEQLIRELRSRGVRVLIDGAHAPGMLPLALGTLGADYYTGNAHKWLCAPKGAAFLFVRRELQPSLRPLVISHGASLDPSDPDRFQTEFGWTGTNDPTAWICIQEAIELGREMTPGGWEARMQRNRALALEARRLLCDTLGVPPACPDRMIGSMASLPLPASLLPPADSSAAIDPLQERLRGDGVDVPVVSWPHHPHRLVRISAQLYNERQDYAFLAQRLLHLRR